MAIRKRRKRCVCCKGPMHPNKVRYRAMFCSDKCQMKRAKERRKGR